MNKKPKVTVVIPSFNKAPYVREAVDSVLKQTYRNVEVIVYDAGSTDGTVEVLKGFNGRLKLHVEPDKGQSDAINKGFRAATGDILTWLCADDVLFPDAIERVVAHFEERPEVDLLYGRGWHVDGEGRYIRTIQNQEHNPQRLLNVDYILQPATFFRRSVFEKVGELDVDCNWGMDWDYWIRAAKRVKFLRVQDVFAKFRLTPDIKTLSGGLPRLRELARICRRHGGSFQPTHVVFSAMIAAEGVCRNLGERVNDGVRRVLKRVFRAVYGPWAMYG